MEDPHPLKALLQLQLASDSYAVLHLPYVLDSITSDYFLPSAHTQKWTARINSLLHSKDAGARWSGLCIAFQTALCSRTLMMECAQSWVGVALPLLSKNEPNPTLKMSIRLLRHIFSSATDVAEFQRQLSAPNVPKFSLALITVAEKQDNEELKLLAITTLSHLVPLYPTLHRALHGSLSSCTLKFLNGSAPNPTSKNLLAAASQLYSIMPVTGGKVGASNLWRQSLDETLSFLWGAFLSLRTTFPSVTGVPVTQQSGSSREDPVIAVPLNLDRLRAGVHILCDLLRTATSRPVVLPLGPLVRIVLALLRCTPEEKVEGHVDPTVRALEVSVIPTIWSLACRLLDGLAESAQSHLTSHTPQLISHLAFHLEQQLTPCQRLCFLKSTSSLLKICHPLDDVRISSRMGRAILPSLTRILATESKVQADLKEAKGSKNKKGKKRTRGYEGDELFKAAREVLCPTPEEGQLLLTALDALAAVFRKAQLMPVVHSIATRVLLSIYISLPQIPPALLSPDVDLHRRLYVNIRNVCVRLASGSSAMMSKSLGLVIAIMEPNPIGLSDADIQQEFDLLFHPRVPPLVRSIPHVDMLSLFHSEESEEERDTRHLLRLGTIEELCLTATSGLVDKTPIPPSALSGERPNVHTSVNSASRMTEMADFQSAVSTVHHGPMQSTQSDGALSTIATHAPVVTSNSNIAESPSIQPQTDASKPHNTNLDSSLAPLRRLSTASAPSPIAMSAPTPGIPSISSITQPVASIVPMDQDDEDEPMPTINMESDSESD
ncbi:hypothetical protein AcW1_004463 [Taiwanofungus camphoratus]|nr:hypothetical protein AcV5_000837 [Antrodia cinnamomea]KAI0952333.1 hypothetical protein AcV7_008178 [Antrodia cinnamomea]KAI0959716.1 hypothetical protein AcW1_004463 [Antrodia cinnamomea]